MAGSWISSATCSTSRRRAARAAAVRAWRWRCCARTADGERQPGTVSAAALGLLRCAAEESPVLVAVDDLQWLDAATAATLTYALRRLGDAPVLLLATARTEEERGRATGPIAGQRMVIPPLDVESLSRLIARELGQRLPWPVVRRIATIAAGNAFLAIELARVAIAVGRPTPTSSRPRRCRGRLRQTPGRDPRAGPAGADADGAGDRRCTRRTAGADARRARCQDEAALDAAFDAGVDRGAGRSRAVHASAAGRRRALQPVSLAP